MSRSMRCDPASAQAVTKGADAATHTPPAAASKEMSPKKGDTSVLGVAPEELDAAASSLYIDDEELDAAFEFFDVDKTGTIRGGESKGPARRVLQEPAAEGD